MSEPMFTRKHGARILRGCLVLVAVAVVFPVPAFAAQQLVVVRKSGQTSSYMSNATLGKSAMAACSDDSVAFAFTVEPRDGAMLQLERSNPGSRDIILNVNLSCSNLSGTALIPFDAGGGTAVRGTDYLSTPGMAILNLTSAQQSPGASPAVTASVRVEVLNSPQAGTAAVTFSIVRREGSFQGSWADGSPIVGSVPGSNDPIVAVTITGATTIYDAAEIVPGIDTAASEISFSTTIFCRANGGGAGTAGCRETQRAADLIDDPSTPGAVRDAATVVLENNLLAIAPDETTALAFIAPRLAAGQRDNLSQRLAALRSADLGGTMSASGLSVVSNGLPVSLGGLPFMLGLDDETSANNEEQRTLLGGTRLGLWVNGTIGGGERDRRKSNSGFDSDTWEVTSGLDYRFTDRLFAGAALGFSHMSLDFERDQGSLDVDARSVHVYSGYSLPSGISFDGSVSYMRSDFAQRRSIELLALDASGTSYHSLGRDVARGDTNVNQYGANLGMTWTIMRDTWTFAPQVQVSTTRTEYEAFEEAGPSEFNLAYRERRGTGHSLSLGTYIDRTFATRVGAFRPYGRAFYFADRGASKDLLAEFVLAGDDGARTPVALTMNTPDRRYGTGELGLGYSRPIGTRTVDFNIGYMQMFSFSDFDRWALRFDVRVPL